MAARPELAFHLADPPINVLNYEHQGGEFQQIVAWLFGDRKLLPMVGAAESEKERNLWRAQTKDRSGIEVGYKDGGISRAG